MVDQGHHNRILMANRAISAYQQSRLPHDPKTVPDAPAASWLNCSELRFR
jgi:hypothetical protein